MLLNHGAYTRGTQLNQNGMGNKLLIGVIIDRTFYIHLLILLMIFVCKTTVKTESVTWQIKTLIFLEESGV